MCFAHVKYSCNHKEKRRLKCRKLWSARTGWCCYPAFLLAFGWPNEEPCGDFVQGKAVFSSKICPECTEAEQSTPQTNGIVPSKYRHKLTPEALNASRRRMQEEKEKENAVKERWYSREENFQEMLRKREQEERLDRDAAAGTTAEAVKPLPGMPSLIHVPLGDRWGDPSYHYPPHVADAYDTAPITPPRDPVLLGSRTGINNLSEDTRVDTAPIVTSNGENTLRAQSKASNTNNISRPRMDTQSPVVYAIPDPRRSRPSRRDGGTVSHKPWPKNVRGPESPVAEAPSLRIR
ncbi:hypothetical protein LX36DRAFT_680521 [Colletotrichum falcatum]|nr:hypothetical protein LX36DRAFT_680521 [Colletotrichum falcatum]